MLLTLLLTFKNTNLIQKGHTANTTDSARITIYYWLISQSHSLFSFVIYKLLKINNSGSDNNNYMVMNTLLYQVSINVTHTIVSL